MAEHVAATHLAALDPKLEALLLEVRKKAASSLSLRQTLWVIEAVGGWKTTTHVRLLNMSYTSDKRVDFYARGEEPLAKIEAKHAEVKAHEVSAWPTSPRAGADYYLNVSPVASHPSGGGHYFTCTHLKGIEVLEFVDPAGHAFDLAPEKSDAKRDNVSYKKVPAYLFWAWALKESTIVAQANDLLGLGEHVPSAQRTRENTGSCPACFRNVKLASGRIVLHGYTRPGWGSIQGSCFGVGFPPYELSPEGTKALVKHLTTAREEQERLIQDLEGGRVQRLTVPARQGVRFVYPVDPSWDEEVQRVIARARHTVVLLDADVKKAQRLVDGWKLRPLPKEGEAHPVWR